MFALEEGRECDGQEGWKAGNCGRDPDSGPCMGNQANPRQCSQMIGTWEWLAPLGRSDQAEEVGNRARTQHGSPKSVDIGIGWFETAVRVR